MLSYKATIKKKTLVCMHSHVFLQFIFYVLNILLFLLIKKTCFISNIPCKFVTIGIMSQFDLFTSKSDEKGHVKVIITLHILNSYIERSL